MNNKLDHTGWTNYETMLANLWINNDLALYNYLKSLLREDKSIYSKAANLAEMMDELLEDNVLNVTLASDLLRAAIDRIRWEEIIRYNS
jgi:hypothetical protein